MTVDNYKIFPIGDTAVGVDFGNCIDISLNKKVIQLCEEIKAANWIGIKDIVPAYSSLAIYYDVVVIAKQYPAGSPFAIMKNKLEGLLLQQKEIIEQPARKLNIPVCYASKYALDREGLTKLTKLSFDEVVQIHTSRTYHVFMIGFLPGFAYMGEVDGHIAVPRKQEPRLTIQAGSVGIAGKQTGIYPLASPGGWQIVGRTPLKLFDKEKEDPTLFKAGDEVQFFSISEDEFENY